MSKQTLIIKTEDSIKEVQRYILALFEESEEYAGDIVVVVMDPQNESLVKILSHVYDVSEVTINVLKEHYGDYKISLINLKGIYAQ